MAVVAPGGAARRRAGASSPLMVVLRVFPLFAILLLVFNIIALSASNVNDLLDNELLRISLPSGTVIFKISDLLITLGALLLYVELFKATRTSTSSVVDHAMSMVIFVIFLIEFIMVKGCGNSTFMIVMLMSLLDVVAGFSITIVAARRDFAMADAGG